MYAFEHVRTLTEGDLKVFLLFHQSFINVYFGPIFSSAGGNLD